ncbi:MAG: aminotransferase class I/II-fold pyridoxal phosphate-dependent enzyme [Actinobacteria bacterium]|nr:aminotransferase class I/II-fold pyridoxal phosphate-dependent enzyme [Actinomycetota bacterium]
MPLQLPMNAQATDPASLERHFGGGEGLLPLWIAEPYLDLAPAVVAALQERADIGWYGYEVRPESAIGEFWKWTSIRHDWTGAGLATIVSPSVGTSIGVLIDQLTEPGDGVILQPPVFTDFKSLITAAKRTVVRNPLELTDDGYRMNLDDLAKKAADPTTRALILCSPHNPVGRVWTVEELEAVVAICARHDVFVIADEIHGDLTLPPATFVPFAEVAKGTGVSWAALHGPIKTFGLAGVCDTLVVTDDDRVAKLFETRSSQLHLTRNNVFGIAAFEAAYRSGASWLDDMLELVQANQALLDAELPDGIEVAHLEGTYLAWLDFRSLRMDARELASWLAESARLGLSPGHWFGREGAGFARMTIAAPPEQIEDAIARLQNAVATLKR